MGCLVLLLLIAWPIAEIDLMIRATRAFGLPWVLLALAVAAIVGSAIMRRPGLGVANRVRRAWARGVAPARELFDALLVLAAGFLLVFPGFLSDGIALLLLLPPVRALLFWWATARLMARVQVHSTGGFEPGSRPSPGGPRRPAGDVVIDAEWEEVRPDGPAASDRPALPDPQSSAEPGERDG